MKQVGFQNVHVGQAGHFTYTTERGKASANFPLFLIQQAWHRNCNFEAEADGFGKGEGTKNDWSAIRDSSDEAKNAMLAKALNFFFAAN